MYRRQEYELRYSKKYDFWHSNRKEYQMFVKQIPENKIRHCGYEQKYYAKTPEQLERNKEWNRKHQKT